MTDFYPAAVLRKPGLDILMSRKVDVCQSEKLGESLLHSDFAYVSKPPCVLCIHTQNSTYANESHLIKVLIT